MTNTVENSSFNDEKKTLDYLAEKNEQRLGTVEADEFGEAIEKALDLQDAMGRVVMRLRGLELLAASIADGTGKDDACRPLVELLALNLGEAVDELERLGDDVTDAR